MSTPCRLDGAPALTLRIAAAQDVINVFDGFLENGLICLVDDLLQIKHAMDKHRADLQQILPMFDSLKDSISSLPVHMRVPLEKQENRVRILAAALARFNEIDELVKEVRK